jgi:cellulose synthase/poly-beta-1,6-N-acetylglucosamine synthase-like glycosyltransferase
MRNTSLMVAGFSLLDLTQWLVAFFVILFFLRRLILVAAASMPRRKTGGGILPSVVVVAALRNEEGNLSGLLDSLSRLDYPPDKLRFVFVNDASEDSTGSILLSWAAGPRNAVYLQSAAQQGKARALNRALEAAPEAELIAVYDADLRPQPGSLAMLAAAFHDPRVGAVTGYRCPVNPASTPVTVYGALESFVHQLVTQAGKERLNLNPTTLGGNCVYRRSALMPLGGFPPGAFSEDIEVSLALVGAGWRTRFLPEAVATYTLTASLPRFWNQRARWTRGIYASAKRASRLESLLVSAGYADRLIFLAAVGLAAARHTGWLWPALYLFAPAIAVVTALVRARAGAALVARMALWVFPMFVVDVAATAMATLQTMLRRPLIWKTGAG